VRDHHHLADVRLDETEIDALRLGLSLLVDIIGQHPVPTPETTASNRHGGVTVRRASYMEDYLAARMAKAQRDAIARLDRKLRAIA
jgi:hypothetical protein